MTNHPGNQQGPVSPNHMAWQNYVSPARLSLWLKCPLAFRLRYHQGSVPPISPLTFVREQFDAALGLFHRLAQGQRHLDLRDFRPLLEQSWNRAVSKQSVRFDSPAEETLYRRRFWELFVAYVTSLPQDEPAPLAVMAFMEARLIHPGSGEDLGMPLVARVDLVLDTRPRGTLVDFSIAGPNDEFLEILHEIELSCCAYVYRRNTGVCEQGLEIRRLVRTNPPTVEFHHFPPRQEYHFRRLFAAIAAYREDLRSQRFVARPGPDCADCDYCSNDCPHWTG